MENIKQLTFTLSDLALILTLLDQEAHRVSYYPETATRDGNYISLLRQLQHILVANISPDKVPGFAQANPHLFHLFPDYIDEYNEDGSNKIPY